VEHHTKQPKREECLALLNQFSVPEGVLQHSLKVNEVAVFLGQKLVEKQELIDLQVLDRASLLHDIFKHNDSSEIHCARGAELLAKMGFPDTANAIKKHYTDFIIKSKFANWEELLVYYADKRVDGSLIVSVDERLDRLSSRHPDYSGDIEKIRANLKKLEAQLFRHLSFRPEQLAEKIKGFTGAQFQYGC